MNLVYSTVRVAHIHQHPSPAPFRKRILPVRSSSLPIPIQKAKYHRELQAAVDVVERACRLCVDVKSSQLSSEVGILEKNDQTPVTIADFGVQALVSLELDKLFPHIPLVAEEDSSFIQANNLEGTVLNVVTDKASSGVKPLYNNDVLKAIDRGGKDAFTFGLKPATYWVLDPIDGTRGFLKGSEALYVVGLALVVDGEIVLGVMGCPNWKDNFCLESSTEIQGCSNTASGSGIIMVAHFGCGTWSKKPEDMVDNTSEIECWTRCFVDGYNLVHQARYCISDSQTWESSPLSASFNAITSPDNIGDTEVLLLPTCCGSLCKYLMVASGRASVFILGTRAKKMIKVWDHAVGVICVHEAGGRVTDWKGNQLDLAADEVERRIIYPSGGVLVTNGNLHSQILEMIPSSTSSII